MIISSIPFSITPFSSRFSTAYLSYSVSMRTEHSARIVYTHN